MGRAELRSVGEAFGASDEFYLQLCSFPEKKTDDFYSVWLKNSLLRRGQPFPNSSARGVGTSRACLWQLTSILKETILERVCKQPRV